MAGAPEQQPIDSTQGQQPRTRFNPPGLSQLTYRGGRYNRALQQMLVKLPAQSGADTETPLASLNAEVHNDWTLALLRAWAAATEVLGFYQERIINEGYLATATEPRSVLELTRSIGYEPRPGVAASADLAFTVQTTRDEPSRQVVIPAGTAVQSVPGPGEKPQTFETSTDFTARSEWNAFKLAQAQVQASCWPLYPAQKAASARLIGADTGLRAGETILIVDNTPQDGRKRPWLLATLKTVQPFSDRGYTLVTWEDPPAVVGTEPLYFPQVFALRDKAALFGYSPASVLTREMPAPGDRPEIGWAPAAIGLPQTAVHTLRRNEKGVLFAGTGQGLYRSADQGETWQPVNAGLMPKDTLAITTDQEGLILAGMDDGHIYQSKDGGENWTALSGEEVVLPPRGLAKLWSRGKKPLSKTVIRSLAAFSPGRRQILAAATDEGIFLSRDRGKNWLPQNQDLPNTDAKTGLTSVVAWVLATTGTKKKANLFAGTDAGVFHIQKENNLWLMIAAIPLLALLAFLWPAGSPIEAQMLSLILWHSLKGLIELVKTTEMLIGLTWQNFHLSIDLWNTLATLIFFLLVSLIADLLLVIVAPLLNRFLRRRVAVSLGVRVRALVAGEHGQLFAGTEKGVYCSNDGAAGNLWRRAGHWLARFLLGDLARRWAPVNEGLTNLEIRALAVDGQGNPLVGTGDGAVFTWRGDGKKWETHGIDLPVTPIEAIWADKSRAFVAGSPPKNQVERNWSPFQAAKKQVDLDQVYPQASRNSWLVLNGEGKDSYELYWVTRVEVAESQDPARPGRFSRITADRCSGLDGFDRGSTQVRFQGQPFRLLSDQPPNNGYLAFDRCVPGLKPGQRLAVSGKCMRARLLSQPEQVIYEPAGDGDETVSEIVEIVDVKEDRWKRTMVKPNSPLGNRYDWATVTVNGNVVRATHGKTIEGELLGAGEGLATHQSFLLKHHPLTYTSAAGDSGVESALKIEIDGVRWQEVTSFDRLDQTRRAFLLRNDEQENTAVIFGFGQRGTGVPWGAKQIRATYRQGLGQEGNVSAGCLHLLQNALPGLKAVSNPLAASGGADPETMDEAQEKAPLSVRLTERIVSFSDYEDYARQFAGIGKAEARLLSRGNQQVLHITIAGSDGNEVEEESDVYRNLAEAIDQLRASPLLQVHIASYRRVLIQLKARVWIDPAHEAHKTEIKKAVEDGLKDAFAFNRRKFAQPVVAAEISALIQSIPGVVAVELEHLHRHGQEAKLNPLLMAQAARWEEDGPQAAEMLVISPGDVIELDLETAP